jgi:3-oxoacyl-[acyl-carrier protein] reductase
MDLQLSGRVALVCGSSSGIGFAIASRLVAEGCAVALNGRDHQRLDDAVTRLQSHRPPPIGIVADVTDRNQIDAMVEDVTTAFGPIDIVVCNAAGPPPGTFASLPSDHWQAALQLNLLSTVHLCRAVVPGMRERGWGRVICLTSFVAKQPLDNLILSTTARAGVLGFSKALADEVARDGVTVNTICPGWTRTDRVEELLEALAKREQVSREEVLENIVRDIPAKRMAEPEEIAAVVAFLASESAAYVTGVALGVDGGLVRSIL